MSLDEGSPINFKDVKVKLENIHIQGIDRTNEEYVKNQFHDIFKTNNFYDLIDQTNQLKNRLHKVGAFKSINAIIDSTPNAASKTSYDIILEVEEFNPVTGGVHSSIGNNEGSMNTSVGFPNVFGKGERISAEYAYGTRNHVDYRLNYSSPINMNPDKQFSTSFFRSSNDFSWSKYKQDDCGLTMEFLSPFNLTLRNKFELKGSHIFSYEGVWRHMISALDSSFAVREQSGHSLKSSIKYTNQIDKRDSTVLPTKGGFLKSSMELAGLGGDVKFLRTNCDYQFTKTFFEHITTQLSFSTGFMIPLVKKENILINDRFFLGGPLTLRGFSNRGAGPHKDDCSLGNTAYWLAGAHLYTPLPFLHNHKGLSSWFKTHSFVNIGNLFSANAISRENLINNTRLAVGSGLVIGFGKMARLELNYVLPVLKNENDKSVKGLQFGIGIHFN